MKPHNHPIFQQGLQFQLLADARAHVIHCADQKYKNGRGGARIGVACPCCGQLAAVYPRKFNTTMALAVMLIVQRFKQTGDWVCMPEVAPRYILRSNQWGTAAYWELIIQKPNDSDKRKRCSGYWKPTQKGIDFVEKRCLIPRIVHLYDKQIQGYSTELISIDEALGDHYDYTEMMEKLR